MMVSRDTTVVSVVAYSVSVVTLQQHSLSWNLHNWPALQWEWCWHLLGSRRAWEPGIQSCPAANSQWMQILQSHIPLQRDWCFLWKKFKLRWDTDIFSPPAISAPAPASRAAVSWEETEVAASELRATACRLKSRNEEEDSWLTSQTPPASNWHCEMSWVFRLEMCRHITTNKVIQDMNHHRCHCFRRHHYQGRTTYLVWGGSDALGGEEHELDGGDLRLDLLQLGLQADHDGDGELSGGDLRLNILHLFYLFLFAVFLLSSLQSHCSMIDDIKEMFEEEYSPVNTNVICPNKVRNYNFSVCSFDISSILTWLISPEPLLSGSMSRSPSRRWSLRRAKLSTRKSKTSQALPRVATVEEAGYLQSPIKMESD